jgi:hypothetical protein
LFFASLMIEVCLALIVCTDKMATMFMTVGKDA